MSRKRKDGTRPFQFDIDEAVHKKGLELTKANGVSIAPFMRMAYTEFVNRPIEESMKMLRKYHERSGGKV